MGLLSKAAINPSPPVLDEMGNALCSRLLSLEPGSTRAETAITLLRAYGSFSTGICLSLRDGLYTPYASVGAGSTALAFPPEKLRPLGGKTYYSVDPTPADPAAMDFASGNFAAGDSAAPGEPGHSPRRFWAFPLVPVRDPYPSAILLTGEDRDSFSGETLAAVVEKTGEVFLPPEDTETISGTELPEPGLSGESFEVLPFTAEQSGGDVFEDPSLTEEQSGRELFDIETELENTHRTAGLFDQDDSSRGGLLNRITRAPPRQEGALPSSPLEKAVVDFLDAGHEKFGAFQGIILEALRYSADEFGGRIGAMVSAFGMVQGIAPGRCLVLFSASQDRELLARHLVRTVPGKDIFSFKAEDPQAAFTLLKPYL
ncbi:MAG: hypothetical protein LBO65_04350 [Spirochaetaceae bacterium]|jgi:hypothetical protein|nr:hypothetical protein [Spirochaetaceae bacterium]